MDAFLPLVVVLCIGGLGFLLLTAGMQMINYEFHSDLKILGLDILDVSPIDFVLSPDNQIYLLGYSSYYNDNPCYRSIAMAKLIGATLEVKNGTLHWIINGKTIHKTCDGQHILVIPTGEVISYDQRSRYSTDIGKTVMRGILRSSDNGKYILKDISYAKHFDYERIDTYEWNN